MKLTVATLFDGKMQEHFTAVFEGEVSSEQRNEIARNMDAVYVSAISESDAERQLYFVEVDSVEVDTKKIQFINICS